MKMDYLSLREISRRLGIPASSVTYYKDRFSGHIPRHAGQNGRRTRYPFAALTLFKEIRAMFEQNFSAEQIDQELSNKNTDFFHSHNFNQQLNNELTIKTENELLVAHLGSLLEKTSSLLENQSLFRAEIDSLHREIETLRQEKSEIEEKYQRKIAALEKDLDELKKEKAEIIRTLLEEAHGAAGNKQGFHPSEALLALPLVIRTSRDEYLGVGGKGESFSLRRFLDLIENNDQGQKKVRMQWSKEKDLWKLEISLSNREDSEHHQHVMELRQIVTPSHNNVIELTSMVSDSNPVPQEILLALFRKIKENFK